MRPELSWNDPGLPERDGVKATVYDVSFNPDGTHMVVAVANLVLVYDAVEGDLVHRLRGHKDTVYTVEYSRDGKRFASGGADKTVIIWTHKGEGILKYTHNDSIQCVVYNPTTEMLASCTATDFGLWAKEQKSVSKHKMFSKIMCARWNNDGQYIALGMFNGRISIRDKQGQEKSSIEREAPIWSLAWSPSREEPYDLLAVACWDQTLSFYQLSGVQHLKDRRLHFYPTSIAYFSNGEYLVVGGSDRRASLCTKEAVRLTTICELKEWVWTVGVRPQQTSVAVGCYGGSISTFNLSFATVHGLYQDRYAYREHMTDVIVQHMLSEKRVRIKCRDYVKKIAVYKDRLAVQLPDRISVYELHRRDEGASIDLHYRARKEKIYTSAPCQLLVVTAEHIVLCNERKLQMYTFSGSKEREWLLEAPIRYIKVDGGPAGKEGLLVGLKDGHVLKVHVDNPFAIELIKHTSGVRCLDLSLDRKKLAVVDVDSQLVVYDLHTKDITFRASGAQSVAFNETFEEMLCFSADGQLNIRTGEQPVHQHKVDGLVVGFTGAKVFCLRNGMVEVVDIPQSSPLYRFIEAGDFKNAYRIACLGVTPSDWRRLAQAAAQAMALDVARQAFVRVQDLRHIELLNSIEARQQQAIAGATSVGFGMGKRGGGGDAGGGAVKELEPIFQAEILAYRGLYQEAAKVFTRAGHVDRAIDLFADLRQWEEAKLFAANSDAIDTRELVRRQAEWAEEIADWGAAADMYVSAGDPLRAVRLIGENKAVGWPQQMANVARNVTAQETSVLKLCARYFDNEGEDELARETYAKLGDIESLMALYVRRTQWDEALKLADEHKGKFDSALFLPYAEYLALHDRFDEALDAYRRSGRPDQSQNMMEQLTFNAVLEGRFKDAAYYYWLMANETLRAAATSGGGAVKDRTALLQFQEHLHCADLYFAYQHIQSFFLPFTNLQPEMLFQVARFLMNSLGAKEAPHGISRVKILYTLAKQAKALGAFKLARSAYEKLQQLRVPGDWTDKIEFDMLTIQAKPVRDNQELLPVCYRCGATNPLLNPFTNQFSNGDVCTNCGHPFVRSFINFETLPLVEFHPEPELTDDETIELIREVPPEAGKGRRGRRPQWVESKAGAANVMSMGDDAPEDDGYLDDAADGSDLFNRALHQTLSSQEGATSYIAITVDAKTLRSLRREEVYICRPRAAGIRATFYKSMLPEIPLAISQNCHRFFHEEDFEFAVLRDGSCPYSRVADVGDYGPL